MANSKITVVFAVVLVHCICLQILICEASETGSIDQVEVNRVRFLEKRLREDIQRELNDIAELELQLNRNLDLVHEKKRQLEIKRNQPIRCLVSSETCF